MKRLIYIMLCICMLFTAVASKTALAVEREDVEKISTPHFILFEPESKTVLFEKNAYTKAYPASTTKIMTFVVVAENCPDLDRQYTCGDEAWKGFFNQSSLLGLKAGYVMSIRDMLYGLMLCSGNDCGACLAVATAGSEEAFVEMMNQKAAELGMTGTHYTNPHGLHNDEHYTTALDMALLMSYALDIDIFREVIGTLEYTIVEANGKFTKTILTSNKLLLTKPDIDWDECKYEYAIGGKTGETNVAGYCLVEAAEKDGVTLVAVLLGDSNAGGTKFYYRFHSAVKLFEYGFEHYVSYDLSRYNVQNAFNVQTTGYKQDDPNNGMITAEVDISEVRVKGLKEDLEALTERNFSWHEPEIDEEAVCAPVAVGDKLGTATLYMNGRPLYTGDLIAASEMQGEQQETATASPSQLMPKESGGSRDICNLTVSKNGGEAEYTVWVYYKNTMFTMQDGLTWHYLYCDGDVFRSAKTPGTNYELQLYKRSADEAGNTVYELADMPVTGNSYVVVSQGKAMQSVKKGRSLAAVPVTVDENGRITSEVSEDMVWDFTANGSGYQLTSNGLKLHRSGGDGLLFWILIAALVIALIIVIRLIATGRSRRRNPKRRGRYKIYRM